MPRTRTTLAIGALAAAALTTALAGVAQAAQPDPPFAGPGYICQEVEPPRSAPQIEGQDCQAVHGAPSYGPFTKPVTIAEEGENPPSWYCVGGGAANPAPSPLLVANDCYFSEPD